MPKYTYSGDQAALILPTKPRLVLDKGVAVEVAQAEHEKLLKHKIIGALIESGEIVVADEEKQVKSTRSTSTKQED
ncbi:hypothetical protein [Acinetobacter sp. YH01025]|uniref:hypothetical protein n=1 Tax=Acinetobacter sp. YH01025 TaxID=2601038 RepID=UPI0015D3AC0A|nr:hypothetical protein [Acinetobacter sp. YH01025]